MKIEVRAMKSFNGTYCLISDSQDKIKVGKNYLCLCMYRFFHGKEGLSEYVSGRYEEAHMVEVIDNPMNAFKVRVLDGPYKDEEVYTLNYYLVDMEGL